VEKHPILRILDDADVMIYKKGAKKLVLFATFRIVGQQRRGLYLYQRLQIY